MVLALALLLAGFALVFDPDAFAGGAAAPAPPAASTPGAPALPGGAIPPATPPPVINLKPVSLFITPEELSKINDAIATYKHMREAANTNAENQAKNFLNQLQEPAEPAVVEPPKPILFTYPQFFLQSLTYHSQDDWMVQINGVRFIPHFQDLASPLKVVMVNNDMVVMEWKPDDMEKVSQSWMVAATATGQSDVMVDTAHSTVTFTLKPNQTFSSYVMRVLEGKVQPMTVLIQPEPAAGAGAAKKPGAPAPAAVPAAAAAAPKPADAAAPEAAAPAAPKTAEEALATSGKKEGLTGLSETYKKMGLEP